MGLNLIQGNAGEKNHFSILSRDKFHNFRGDIGKTWKDEITSIRDKDGFFAFAKLVENSRGGIDGVDFPISIVYNYETKMYDATYIPITSGKYILNITLSNETLGSNVDGIEHISGSPFMLDIFPGRKTFPDESIVYSNGKLCSLTYPLFNETCPDIAHGVAGVEQRFFVESLDSNRNPRGIGGDQWIISSHRVDSTEPYQYGRIADDQNGWYNLFVTPLLAGINMLSVMLNGAHAKGSPFHLHVTHNVAHGPSSFLITNLNTTIVTATRVNHLMIQPVDAYSNLLEDNSHPFVTNVSVTLENLSNTSINTEGNIILSKGGKIRASYVPSTIGPSVLSIQINDHHIDGSPFNIDVVAGQIKSSKSSASGLGLSFTYAGDRAEFIIQARDSSGNPTSDFDGDFIATLEIIEISARPPGTNLDWGKDATVFIESISIGDGQYLMQYNATVSGTYSMKVMTRELHGDDEISGSPFTVTVEPTVAFPENCEVTGRGSRAGTAGETGLVKVYSRDKFGNYLTSGGDKFNMNLNLISRHQQDWESNKIESVAIENNPVGTFSKRFNFADNGNGQYYAYYVPSFSGKYDLEVVIDKPGGLNGLYFDVQDFDSSHLVFKRSDKEINRSWIVNESSNGVDAKRYADCITRSQSDYYPSLYTECEGIDYLLPTTFFSIEWAGKIEAGHSEEYTIRVECNSDGEVQIIIKDEEIIPWSLCFGKVDGNIILQDSERVPIMIRFKHKFGDAFIRVKWSCPSAREFVIIPEENLYREMMISGMSYSPEILPNVVNAQSSTIIGSSVYEAIAGIEQKFIIETRDSYGNGKFGNLLLNGETMINVFARGGTTNEEQRIDSSILDNKNGTYTVYYTPIISGSYILSVTIDHTKFHPDLGYFMEDLSASLSHLYGSPFHLRVFPGETDPQSCHINEEGPIKAMAGEEITLEIHSKDAQGNLRDAGGDYFEFLITSNGHLNTSKVAETEVIDLNNGKYLLKFAVMNDTGDLFLHVLLHSKKHDENLEIMDSPYNITIVPGEANASKTHLASGAILSNKKNGEPEWSLENKLGYTKQFDVSCDVISEILLLYLQLLTYRKLTWFLIYLKVITADSYGNYLREGGANFVGKIRGETNFLKEELDVKVKDNK